VSHLIVILPATMKPRGLLNGVDTYRGATVGKCHFLGTAMTELGPH